MSYRKSFTLIELLVVIIIVGILASVAIPMMRGYVNRARMTEAVAALGTLIVAEKAYYFEHGSYQWVNSGSAPLPDQLRALGIEPIDLDGVYFENKCYQVYEYTPGGFRITCFSYLSTGRPKSSEVNKFKHISMSSAGSIQIEGNGLDW